MQWLDTTKKCYLLIHVWWESRQYIAHRMSPNTSASWEGSIEGSYPLPDSSTGWAESCSPTSRIQLIAGCWPEALLSPLTCEFLHKASHNVAASLHENEGELREMCKMKTSLSFGKTHVITFTLFHLLELKYQVWPTLRDGALHKGTAPQHREVGLISGGQLHIVTNPFLVKLAKAVSAEWKWTLSYALTERAFCDAVKASSRTSFIHNFVRRVSHTTFVWKKRGTKGHRLPYSGPDLDQSGWPLINSSLHLLASSSDQEH